jgi:hypothetical protein
MKPLEFALDDRFAAVRSIRCYVSSGSTSGPAARDGIAWNLTLVPFELERTVGCARSRIGRREEMWSTPTGVHANGHRMCHVSQAIRNMQFLTTCASEGTIPQRGCSSRSSGRKLSPY